MSQIELTRLEADPRNANICDADTLAKIEGNIQRTGLCPPLIVRKHPSRKSKYIVIDGHHRLQILKRLGWKKVECQIWDIDEKEAAVALATLNRLRGTDNPVKRAELFNELTQHFSLPDLAHIVPESPKDIQDLLALLKLDTEVVEQAIEKQVNQEKETLPVPFGCLLSSAEHTLVERALGLFQGNTSQQLVAMSQFTLTHKGTPDA